MSKNSVVKEREGSGQLSISLHPLVIINTSDHWTRNKVQLHQENPRVIGALLGIQTGRQIEIFNSFELVFSVVDGAIVIDQTYLHKKQEQFKKVFPTYDFLGWYSTGSLVQASDIDVHKQIMEVNESPLYLLMDAVACLKPSTKDLPITVFESELHMVDDKPTTLFVKIPYKIETGEAERISVDHIARVTPTGGGEGSSLSGHLTHTHNAISMLNMRIKILVNFLQAAKEGKIPKDHALLRRISMLTSQLPAVDSSAFKREFINEYNDALLITYLATVTKSANGINDLLDKFSLINDKQSRRRGFF
jgi:COP9 signalosome complex subunit 6